MLYSYLGRLLADLSLLKPLRTGGFNVRFEVEFRSHLKQSVSSNLSHFKFTRLLVDSNEDSPISPNTSSTRLLTNP